MRLRATWTTRAYAGVRSTSQAAIAASVLVVARAGFAQSSEVVDGDAIVVQGRAASSFSARAKEGEGARDAPDVASLLDRLPGVRVRTLGAEGGFSTLTIRGASSNQVALTLAGVPLTGAADPSLDLATIPLWPGASVRVHRTFAPAALGGGYLGGLVQIDPVDASLLGGRRSRTEIYDAAGAFGALRLRASDVRRLGDGDGAPLLATGVSASRWGGGFAFVDPSAGPGNERDRTRDNAGFTSVAGLAHARVEDGAWSWLATALGSARRDGVPGPLTRPSPHATLARERALVAVEARRRDEDGRWLVRAWTRADARRFDDPFGELATAPGQARDATWLAGASVGRRVQPTSGVTIDARVEASSESTRAYRPVAVTGDVARRRIAVALAVDAEARIFSTIVALAARLDALQDTTVGDARALDGAHALPVAHLGVETTVLELAGARVDFAAHAGVLARSPSFLELLGDGGVYAASPALRSERALSADAGFRGVAQSGALRAELEAVAFASSTSDQIVQIPTGLGTLRAENVGSVLAFGGEVVTALQRAPFTAIATYTLLHTEDRTHEAATRGQPLAGRPMHDFSLDWLTTLGPVTARYSLDALSSMTLDRAGTITSPARALHAVGVTVRLGGVQRLEIAGQIDNLFDLRWVDVVAASSSPTTVRYPIVDVLEYPIVGRRWTVSVRGRL